MRLRLETISIYWGIWVARVRGQVRKRRADMFPSSLQSSTLLLRTSYKVKNHTARQDGASSARPLCSSDYYQSRSMTKTPYSRVDARARVRALTVQLISLTSAKSQGPLMSVLITGMVLVDVNWPPILETAVRLFKLVLLGTVHRTV